MVNIVVRRALDGKCVGEYHRDDAVGTDEKVMERLRSGTVAAAPE